MHKKKKLVGAAADKAIINMEKTKLPFVEKQ
jgi:hypothetical protein